MGNRLHARITQRSTNGVLHLNDRSHLYTYDGLQRLETADTGKLNSTNDALQSGTLILGIDWTLDNLGNWSGDTTNFESVLRTGNFDQDPQLETIAINHDVDMANRLESVTTDGTSVSVQTDLAGNVIHDGTRILRYDAWNRLLEVYEPGTAVLDDYGVVSNGELGDRVAAYSYDGVGRLIRIERTQDEEPVVIDLYYDGVRRIQEVLTTDEGEGGQMAMAGGGGGTDILSVALVTPGPEDFGTPAAGSDPGTLELAEATPPPPNPPGGEVDPEADDAAIRLDATSTAVSLTPSEGSTASGGPEPLGGGGAQQMSGMSGQTVIAEREYIWGPDYVDECIVQLDENNTPYYVIQDANYNVVALLDSTGLPVVQYTYEPYGALQLAESFAQHPVNRLGHQGLFFERYDAGPYDPALVPGGKGLYYARNRFYDPVTGRWTTRDPNATGTVVAAALAMNGASLDAYADEADIPTQYGDGLSLYQYVGANPVDNRDPVGLFTEYDPFAEVDDFTFGYSFTLMGAAAQLDKARGNIFGGAVLSAMYASAGFLWDEFVWELGEDALFGLIGGAFGASACFDEDTLVSCAHGSVPINEVGVGECVASRPDAYSILELSLSGTAGSPDGCSSPPYWALTFIHADDSGALWTATLLRSNDWFTQSGLSVGSQCYVAMSEPSLVASASLVSAQLVLDLPACPFGYQLVTGAFTRESAPIQELTFDGLPTPLRTTPTHPFYSLDRSTWVPAESLGAGEQVATAAGGAKVTDNRPVTAVDRVYNLEVEGWHTYFVSEAGIWVHNGCYRHIPDPPTVGPGKEFTKAQKTNILHANYVRNGGRLRSDRSGQFLTARPHTPYSAQIDHIYPRARGGTNSYKNAQVLGARENQSKGARVP